jgi:4-diphosphocytidyl-2-C-methyl-D-erythritol kinase
MPETEDAPAKLNLYLRVLGRRPDGFHDIDTLIVPLSLTDRVSVAPVEGDRAIRVTVTGPTAGDVPLGDTNLAARAVMRLRESVGRDDLGARITLYKRVPVAAGLGGGSADAAAVLRILGREWGVPPPALFAAAAALGSDVPALVYGGPVLARGRGEDLSGVELPPMWWVLLPQRFEVASGDAYRWWDEDGGQPGPEPDVVIEAATAGDVDALSSLLFNDLESPVASRHPEVIGASRQLLEAGALTTIMCGSGPTVAGLCRNEEHAADVASGAEGIAVHTIRTTSALR